MPKTRCGESLTEQGLVDLGGKWVTTKIRDCKVILAGNELPWFLPAADMRNCPPADHDTDPLRILLSHAPDQLPWARANQIDLMLAGHTHGGSDSITTAGAYPEPQPVRCPLLLRQFL